MALGMYLYGHKGQHDVKILSRRHSSNLKLDESRVTKCRLHLSCNQGGATSFEFWQLYLQDFCLILHFRKPTGHHDQNT